jgi:uncharacterized protein (DUF2267 family)
MPYKPENGGSFMALNFDKYAQEGNSFIKSLAKELGHPEEIARTGIILRAVLHTLRDRITIGESLNLISQLPFFLKALYVENWEYREKPLALKTKIDFYTEIENHQDLYGEKQFSWNISTAEIVRIVISALEKYISKGEIENIISQLPKALKELFRETVHN